MFLPPMINLVLRRVGQNDWERFFKPSGWMHLVTGDPQTVVVDVDVSFIQIDHSLETLKDEFASFSKPVPHAADLLAALKFATTNAVPGFDNEPSSSAVVFLKILEDADPNSDAFDQHDDDNNNTGWGHYQYTGGGKNMRNSFPAWGDVGSVVFAQKLVSAGLRTCKVARHLCASRNRIAQSYTADMYLAILVEHLWDIAPTLFKPQISNPQGDNGESGYEEKGLRGTKKPKNKDQYVSAILSCNDPKKQPTMAYVLGLLNKYSIVSVEVLGSCQLFAIMHGNEIARELVDFKGRNGAQVVTFGATFVHSLRLLVFTEGDRLYRWLRTRVAPRAIRIESYKPTDTLMAHGIQGHERLRKPPFGTLVVFKYYTDAFSSLAQLGTQEGSASAAIVYMLCAESLQRE
ncbi:hypothetical protein FA15DRAFT_658794 [Coprinopsis marcescibilis]|uniref:Uncharacterized protein n=1 Tax=Coprinopsis marcescibilis TaxID=230819 RepID=A0A5C3KKS8_COPMA|nr:hypothetical protein FA15DRAFT_658794 [Coprinopsis marcescibilis]